MMTIIPIIPIIPTRTRATTTTRSPCSSSPGASSSITTSPELLRPRMRCNNEHDQCYRCNIPTIKIKSRFITTCKFAEQGKRPSVARVAAKPRIQTVFQSRFQMRSVFNRTQYQNISFGFYHMVREICSSTCVYIIDFCSFHYHHDLSAAQLTDCKLSAGSFLPELRSALHELRSPPGNVIIFWNHQNHHLKMIWGPSKMMTMITLMSRRDYVQTASWAPGSSSMKSPPSSTAAQSIQINLDFFTNWGIGDILAVFFLFSVGKSLVVMIMMMFLSLVSGWIKVAWWRLFLSLRIRIWEISCLWRYAIKVFHVDVHVLVNVHVHLISMSATMSTSISANLSTTMSAMPPYPTPCRPFFLLLFCWPPGRPPSRSPCPPPCRPPQCRLDDLWGLRDADRIEIRKKKVWPTNQRTDVPA